MSLNTPVSGDSTAARPHGLEDAKCSLHKNARGLFYSLTGTGTLLQMTWSTDAPGRFEVALMTDSCNNCTVVSDFWEAEDTPVTLNLNTEKDKEYIVVVTGEGFGDAGSFSLQVQVRKQSFSSFMVRLSLFLFVCLET